MLGAQLLNRTDRARDVAEPIKIGQLTCPNSILRILLVPQRCAGPIPCREQCGQATRWLAAA